MLSGWKRFERRRFLGLGLAAGCMGIADCSSEREPAWRFFTAAEACTVEAICEQIIPTDQDAGASGAGVVSYIDLQLTKHLRRYRGVYREGIARVDNFSRSHFGKALAELPPERQRMVVEEIEKNAPSLFDILLAHTQQGFYGDPRHGGNRDGVSWKMLALPFPPIRGRSYGPKG